MAIRTIASLLFPTKGDGQNNAEKAEMDGYEMMSAISDMGNDFRQWQELTDAYARQIDALARRMPGAAAEIARLAQAMKEHEIAFRETPWTMLPV